ncbi:GIY-YIG nuclease family protein [Ralstonia sp. 25C]|uniref:GIY-YIG nuclease family protein n=1 Tax=Ralstonia sp. 25C TaxID=3447363 RepID=UPI003F74FA79
MPQIIYVLTNEAMPGLVKIGMTTDSVETRISQLSAHSGVPLPFECYFAAEVPDCVKIEKILHQLFGDVRLNPKREFFKLDPEKAVLAISIGDFKEITPGLAEIDKEERDALEKIKARRPKLNLAAIGIKVGDVLTFSRDESVTGVVVDGGRLEFQGEVLSLSAAALKALHRMGYKTPAASGSGYWMLDGELLDERRRRLEEQQYGVQ